MDSPARVINDSKDVFVFDLCIYIVQALSHFLISAHSFNFEMGCPVTCDSET